MLELFEKAFMTAIGIAAISQQKAEELAAEMRERYKLSESEGKQLVEKLQATARENREKVMEMAGAEVQKTVERMGLVSREEFDKLSLRVQELESRFNND